MLDEYAPQHCMSFCQCMDYRSTKIWLLPHRLHTPLSTPHHPWVDISIDFILGFSRTIKEGIVFLLLWIGSQKWIILSHATSVMVPPVCHPCLLKILLSYMGFSKPL